MVFISLQWDDREENDGDETNCSHQRKSACSCKIFVQEPISVVGRCFRNMEEICFELQTETQESSFLFVQESGETEGNEILGLP